MNKMRVYHLTKLNLGKALKLKPNIPECAVKAFEDISTPRICAATSIIGCLRALELPGSDLGSDHDIGTDIYCYVADVDVNLLYQPTIQEVKDVFITGEVWIKQPHEFKLLRIFKLKKLEEVENSLYSRYVLIDPVYSSEDGNYTMKFISHNCSPALLEEYDEY